MLLDRHDLESARASDKRESTVRYTNSFIYHSVKATDGGGNTDIQGMATFSDRNFVDEDVMLARWGFLMFNFLKSVNIGIYDCIFTCPL